MQETRDGETGREEALKGAEAAEWSSSCLQRAAGLNESQLGVWALDMGGGKQQ